MAGSKQKQLSFLSFFLESQPTLYIVRKHVIVGQEMQSLILLTFCQITTCVRTLGEMIRFIWGTPVSYIPEKMSFVGHVLLRLSCWMNFFCSDRWWYTWLFDFDEGVIFPAGLEHCRCQNIRWMNYAICTVPPQYHSHGCGTRAHSCSVVSIETIRARFFTRIPDRNLGCWGILDMIWHIVFLAFANALFISKHFRIPVTLNGLKWPLGIQKFRSLCILVEFLVDQVQGSIKEFHLV